MKTKIINLYSFDELSEKAQQKAIENLWDINVDYDWWDSTYEDAKRIGLNITGFDIGRGNYCNGDFIYSSCEVARLILKEHGSTCDTYKIAQDFLVEWDNLVAKYSDGNNLEVVTEGNEYEFDKEADILEDEFKNSVLEDYLVILRKEYEYLTSKEAILETIETNEYTFTENGKLES